MRNLNNLDPSKIAESTLDSAEKGLVKISIPQLRKITKVYNCPQTIFYLKVIPTEIRIPDFRKINTIEPELSSYARIEIRRIREKKPFIEIMSQIISGLIANQKIYPVFPGLFQFLVESFIS